MALPSSGTISMSQVAAELGVAATGLSLNDTRVRTLAGVPSGAISMSNLHGKSSFVAPTMGIGYKYIYPSYLGAHIYGYSDGTVSYGGGTYGSLTSRVLSVGGTVRHFYWIHEFEQGYDDYWGIQVAIAGIVGAGPYTVIIGGYSFAGGFVNDWQGVRTINVTLTAAQYNALPKSGSVVVDVR